MTNLIAVTCVRKGNCNRTVLRTKNWMILK